MSYNNNDNNLRDKPAGDCSQSDIITHMYTYFLFRDKCLLNTRLYVIYYYAAVLCITQIMILTISIEQT